KPDTPLKTETPNVLLIFEGDASTAAIVVNKPKTKTLKKFTGSISHFLPPKTTIPRYKTVRIKIEYATKFKTLLSKLIPEKIFPDIGRIKRKTKKNDTDKT